MKTKTSKDIRNLILTLVIVAVGVKLITLTTKNIKDIYVGVIGGSSFAGLINALDSIGDLILYGLLIIAILLIPYYLSKRSQEKKI